MKILIRFLIDIILAILFISGYWYFALILVFLGAYKYDVFFEAIIFAYASDVLLSPNHYMIIVTVIILISVSLFKKTIR